MLKVLGGDRPDRPVLFELFMNNTLYSDYSSNELPSKEDPYYNLKLQIRGFKNAGYDYATLHGSDFGFPVKQKTQAQSLSLNEYSTINNRREFEDYKWQNPDDFDYSRLVKLSSELPEGMKFIVFGPSGVLENVTSLVGFDNLCLMVADNPGLAADIFEAVGTRLVRYYEICGKYDSVGAMISNDDWGFNTQTMLSPEHMRKYVFPWHKKIVQAIHKSGKPAILHSCGNLEEVMDDIIDDMKYDAKHSFEDNIMPVEDVYEKYHERIAIMGGIDVNFLCTSSIVEIKNRSAAMLQRSKERGAYALGSGNSIPEYVPLDKYKAMISVAFDE
jgi:uroporphyrinogen decarboxylase